MERVREGDGLERLSWGTKRKGYGVVGLGWVGFV